MINNDPFVWICYPDVLNISICNALMKKMEKKMNSFRITIAFPFGQRTLFPYIKNGRIANPPERKKVWNIIQKLW